MAIHFTVHAQAVMAERKIAVEWVERILASPEWDEPDPSNPALRRAFGRITEFGDRTLRVVYHNEDAGQRVITVFFDRNRRLGPGKAIP